MPQMSPFRGLRFNAARVGDVSTALCPPYDVISPAEQQRLQAANPFNIVRVELSQDMPGDSDGADRYTRAADLLRSWRADAALLEDDRPAYYLLAHTFEWAGQQFTRQGLFTAVRLQPWADGAVLPHEATFSGPKEDRYKLLSATTTNVSPVFMVYRQEPVALAETWRSAHQSTPALEAVLSDERMRLWVVDDPATVTTIGAELAAQTLYIADGHHRYETALRYRDERLAEGVSADHHANFVLSYIAAMDDPGLVVLPTHRLVRGVAPERVRSLLGALGQAVVIESVAGGDAVDALVEGRLAELGKSGPSFAMAAADSGDVTLITLVEPLAMERAAPYSVPAWRALDVSVLQTLILDPLLPTHHERDASITYARDARAALDAVRGGGCQVAFIMNMPSVEGMANVADAGARMPEKSTYFYPKVPTGLVMRSVA